jgi:hypothetical protein
MPRRPKELEEGPDPAVATLRQQLVSLLEIGGYSFEDLRRQLGTAKAALEEDLRHVEKSLRAGGRKLEVQPARCLECGFLFRARAAKHFHPPSRCPKCRSERIDEPRFSMA